MKIIVSALGGLVIAALALAGVGLHMAAAAQDQARAQVRSAQHSGAVYRSEISSLQNSVNTLNIQVANPVDPLSAYSDICNQDETNDQGADQTYYFPCTNNVQTIPQPGS